MTKQNKNDERGDDETESSARGGTGNIVDLVARAGGATAVADPPKTTTMAATSIATAPAPAVEVDPIRTALIEIPVAEPTGYAQTDLGSLPGKHARSLLRLTNGLRSEKAKLKNSKLVDSGIDAVIWILEKIEETVAD